jgi:hypothetical protein
LGDLSILLGFREEKIETDGGEQPGSSITTRVTTGQEAYLGKLADSKIVHEAIVAIPYYLSGEEPNQQPNFINIPPSTPTTELGYETRQLIRKMEKYNLPPALENNLARLKNFGAESLTRGEDGPLACYLFEFEIELSKQDLADIWQGIMPEQSVRMLGKKGERTVYGIDHTLVYDHSYDQDSAMFGERLDSRLRDLMDVQEGFEESANSFRPEIQWLVFKVKQKGVGSYQEMMKKELSPYRSTSVTDTSPQPPNSTNIVERGYNWPYDYFSFIELAKIEGQVRFRPHARLLEDTTVEHDSPGTVETDESDASTTTATTTHRGRDDDDSTGGESGGREDPEDSESAPEGFPRRPPPPPACDSPLVWNPLSQRCECPDALGRPSGRTPNPNTLPGQDPCAEELGTDLGSG